MVRSQLTYFIHMDLVLLIVIHILPHRGCCSFFYGIHVLEIRVPDEHRVCVSCATLEDKLYATKNDI